MTTTDQRLIKQFYEQLKNKEKGNAHRTNGKHKACAEGNPGASKLTDKALLNKLFGEKDGGKWRDLYGGEIGDYYPSASEAVAAVLRKLAFYSSNDPVQMERLIRDSGLDSEKFDEPRGGSTWLQNEISSAIENTTETHGSNRRQTSRGESGKKEAPTHDELRDRWIDANPDHAYGLGSYRRYEGGIWVPEDEAVVHQSMVETLEEAKEEGIKPTGSLLKSVAELVRLALHVGNHRWDADADILVAENGVVDISTGKLLPHEREHYATTCVPYAYDPGAVAPRWRQFVNSTLDKETASFLQEFAGYCLTTETSLEKAIWLIGPPGGGKSTFIEGLTSTLGARAGVLGLAEIQKSQFSLAKLEGKTLVTAAEQPAGFVSCHHVLNAIISGEPVQVERKYRQPYDLVPRAKIVWAMNELPRISSGAQGLFRRIEIVRFPQIAEEDRDPTLKEDIKKEGAGILNWALEGLYRLRERGSFEVPEDIREATEEFKKYNDIPALFVEECCNTGERMSVQSKPLYDAYTAWCGQTGHRPQSRTTIAEDWKRLGFKRYTSNGRSRWKGVELNDDYSPHTSSWLDD